MDTTNDPNFDLFAPWLNSGKYRHNILREINIMASHNAYHTGEIGVLRQVMRLWSLGRTATEPMSFADRAQSRPCTHKRFPRRRSSRDGC